jgi:hypothetical protein
LVRSAPVLWCFVKLAHLDVSCALPHCKEFT